MAAEQKKYLPLGSVVILEGGEKSIMIYGRRQQSTGKSSKIYDYIACLYPEGNLSEDFMYLFNHDQIKEVLFRGYETPEDVELQKKYFDLG